MFHLRRPARAVVFAALYTGDTIGAAIDIAGGPQLMTFIIAAAIGALAPLVLIPRFPKWAGLVFLVCAVVGGISQVTSWRAIRLVGGTFDLAAASWLWRTRPRPSR